jgi:peptidoglycan/LPS O-acetylase OafA/YrhL
VMLLGRASYSVYILQVPVFYVFLRFLPQMWDSAPLFWPYLGALVVLSIAAHTFVEEPARRALSRGR